MMTIYTDGSCSANPGGVAACSFVVYKNGEKLHEESFRLPDREDNSNNLAEFSALLAALKYAISNGFKELTIKSDSALVVNLMNGSWTPRGGAYTEPYREAKELAGSMTILFDLIPREKNRLADDLARGVWEKS